MTAQATSPTTRTWRLPRTVASPAPTNSIAWCQNVRSPAKKMPAISASRTVARGSGPNFRRSRYATAARNGSPKKQR
jgi:hypothetical protein